jgi:hypothetical protein
MLRLASTRLAAANVASRAPRAAPLRRLATSAAIPENEEQSTGLERKEELNTPDIFWSREPIVGHRGTKACHTHGTKQ